MNMTAIDLGYVGFVLSDLFSPASLDAVEKKLDKERSPERQKIEHKPIFQAKKILQFWQFIFLYFLRLWFREGFNSD